MTDNKYVVPQGMIDAALANHRELYPHWQLGPTAMDTLVEILEVAIRWQSENFPEPTDNECKEFLKDQGYSTNDWGTISNIGYIRYVRRSLINYRSRMYLAPEPVVPEAIKDLLILNQDPTFRATVFDYNARIEEAYNRGVASARQEAEGGR